MLKKGDVLGIARIAAIQASKRTSDLIPLCHPISLTKVSVEFSVDEKTSIIHCTTTAQCVGKTGVEMEAIMGVNAALITIYDLCKIVNPDLKIDGIRLLIKQGGKTGTWVNPNGLPEFLKDLF